MTKQTSSVLVFGEDTRAFLAVVRSFGRMGLRVHAAWCPLNSPALASTYIRKVHRLPFYRPDDLHWLEALNQLLAAEEFRLAVPCTDGAMLPLQMHARELARAERICLLPPEAYRVFSSKKESYALAQRLGLPVPAQRVVSSLAELERAAADFGYPLVLKPQSSAILANPLARQQVRKVRQPAGLEEAGIAMLSLGEILVQENFTGKGVGVELLCRNGEVLTAFQHERVHEPLEGGGSSYRKSVPLHPEMLDAAARLMSALSYTGVAMVEYKRDPRSGRWIFIEVNPRFWGSLPLSIAAGLDFPRYLYEMLVEGRTEFPRTYRRNLYCRNWGSDLQWLLTNLRADRRDPDLMTVPFGALAGEAINLVLLRERSDTFVLDDPAPAFADLGDFFSGKLFSLTKGMSWFRAGRHHRARRALKEARNILFLCHGNICRSPFAAEFLKRIAPKNLTVSSSGVFPRAGRQSPEQAIVAARQFGVDLAVHCSEVASQSQIDQADLIFIFDQKNRRLLQERFACGRAKVHFLGALDPEAGPLEIADPYGGGTEEFVNCYSRIAKTLRSGFAHDRQRSRPSTE